MKTIEIIKHFGIRNQLKHLSEEVYELQEAIIDYEHECNKPLDQARLQDVSHVAEEIADIEFLLQQFKDFYFIPEGTITRIKSMKSKRLDKRIEEGYYAKK